MCDFAGETPAQLGRKWVVFLLRRRAIRELGKYIWKKRGWGEGASWESQCPTFLSVPEPGDKKETQPGASTHFWNSRLYRMLSGGTFGPRSKWSRMGNKVFISSLSCPNKLPQTKWFKATDIYSFTVLEAKSLKSWDWHGCIPSKGSRRQSVSFTSSKFWWLSTFLWPPPLFLSHLPSCDKSSSSFLLWGHLSLDSRSTYIIQDELILRPLA